MVGQEFCFMFERHVYCLVGMTFQFHVRDMLNGWSGVSCFMYETCLLFGQESV